VTVIEDQNIDQSFDWPFYLGNPQLPQTEVPGVAQVAIAGHGYIIEPSKYSRVTVPLRRESTDQSVVPGEQSLNTSSAWRRSQNNWFLGAGQEYLDNLFAFVSVYVHSGEEPSVRTRFWRSKGVNPWVEGALTLQPEYGLSQAMGGSPLMEAVGTTVYVAGTIGGALQLTAYPSGSGSSLIHEPGGTTTWPPILSMTTDGNKLYLACGTHGIAVTTAGTTTSTWLRPTGPTPTVVVNGTPATTTWSYYVVATDGAGLKSLVSAVATVTTGAAALTVTDYNEITWAPVAGAVSYDLLRGTTATAVGLGLTGTSFTDDGSHTVTGYTAPTATTLDFPATFVLYANGFLLGGAGPQLVSIGANGTNAQVMTHFNPNWTWVTGCSSPMAIYVSGNCGGSSEIYGVQISTTNFALGSPYIAGQVTEGEQVNDMLYYEGLVVLGTSIGIRAAQDVNQNGHLDTGPVINALGHVNQLAIYGAFVWFSITNYVELDGVWQGPTTTSGLGRLALSQYSAPLIPAYATDVMSTTQGEVTGITVVNGIPWFTVANSGLWEPTGNLVPQGQLESGWVRYGTVEGKILVSSDVRHDPLQGTVQIEVVPFGQSPYLLSASNEQGSTGPPYSISAGNTVGEAFMVIPILTRDAEDPTKGPVLRRWTSRAMVRAVRQDQIVVPIIWADVALSPQGDGTRIHYDLIAEWQFLKGLEQAGTAFTYQEGALSNIAFIDQIELQPDKWNDQKQMLEGILSVKLLTVN
jgi:hypothetical protein